MHAANVVELPKRYPVVEADEQHDEELASDKGIDHVWVLSTRVC
jgi:hypothetical protein